MRASLERALHRDFPIVFAETKGSCRCGDGWEPLIRRVAVAAERIRRIRGIVNVATQAKEKHGALRIYHRIAGDHDRDHRFAAIVRAAENQSIRVCEVCGDRGMLAIARGRIYRALCAQHLSRRAIAAYEAEHAEPGVQAADPDAIYDPAHDYRHLPAGTQPGEFVPGYSLSPIWPITKEPSPTGDERRTP